MKKLFLTPIAMLVFLSGFAQSMEGEARNFSIGTQYTQEFVLDGYVRVGEWELEGDRTLFFLQLIRVW